MTDNDFPPLKTERLILRQLTLDDIEFVYRHFSDPLVTRYLLDEPPLSNLTQAKELIHFYSNPTGKTYNRWGLILKPDNRLIGTCGFHKWEKRYFRAEIGYDLSPQFWGRGLMREALRAVVKHGFERMTLNRIDALIYPDNIPSWRLLRKLGFQQEGILRDYFCLDGQFYDHALWSLLKRDWVGPKEWR